MRFSVLFGLAAVFLSTVAQAADRKIDDFMGRWIGTGTASPGSGAAAPNQSRDSEVIIEKTADGFKISWTTMSSDVDNGSQQ